MRLIAALAVAGVLFAGAASPTEHELQRAADRLIATSDIPAVITLVEQDGKRTVVASGDAEIDRRKARPDDRFWVGSITKSFVATVVMQLVAEHKLGLEDRVSTLLPGRLRAGRRIRLRNLLNHTSGIPDYMRLEPWRSAVARQPTSRDLFAAARLVGRQAPTRVPARKPSLVLEHELSRARGNPPAGHRAVAGHTASATNLRAARPRGNGLRERTPSTRRRPAARLRRLRVATHGRLAARARRTLGRRCDRVERTRPGGVLRRAAARSARPAPTRRPDGEDRSPLAR